MNNLYELQISLLNKCNFSCKHCVTSSSWLSDKSLNQSDIDKIFKAIKEFHFSKITFTGGEPTLNIYLINQFISFIDKSNNKHTPIGMISNGWYSSNENLIDKVLTEILRLNFICLSIDKYHLEHTSIDNLLMLKRYCDKNDIQTLFVGRIEEPLDIIKISEYEKILNAKIEYQYIFPFGRAKENKIGFRNDYFTSSTKLAPNRCPILNCFIFDLNVGFTSCCGDLIFDAEFERYYSIVGEKESLQQYLNSDFYKFLSQNEFIKKEILTELILNSYPIKSLPICSYCSYLFKKTFLKDLYVN